MNSAGSISRRDFIKAASTAGAGLVIGFYLPSGERWGALAAESGKPFAPNAWLTIDTSGIVTVTVAKSEMGQGVLTSLPMILADELEADWSKVKVEQAVADQKYGDMGTGGSTSVRTSWEHLRRAGATAREMLVAAAAQTWKVEKAECRAEAGTVIHKPTGRKLNYGELVAAASAIEPPTDAKLKEPKEFRFIGKPTKRLDTPMKVDGSGIFGLDITVPGMLYATVARCPVFGGKVARFDATKAKAVPGVKHVVQIESGIAIVADSTWAAIQGRAAMEITWDEGPTAKLNSTLIHSMLVESTRKTGAVAERTGDSATALAGAARKIDAVYDLPFLAHATMEPMNCVADVRTESCEIWAPTQSAQWNRGETSRITGLPERDINVHVTLLGGGFGRRAFPDFVVEAVHVSKTVGAPVKVTWTREDDMQHDYYRPVSRHLLSGGLDGMGNLVALTHRIVAPSITAQLRPESIKNGLDEDAVEGAVKLLYDIPNNLVEYVVTDVPIPVGWWRSVYPSQNVLAVECFIDELAAAAKKDPYQFRRQLTSKSPRMKKVLELVAKKSGWGSSLPKGHYRGIACAPPAFFGSYVAHVAEVSVDAKRKVRVHRVVCAIDCGIVVNPDTVEAQMESSIVYGLTAALKGEITIDKGRVVQSNFDDYPLMTIDEMPRIDVHIVPSSEALGGTGEPGLPPIAPAVANAVSAAIGRRIRQLPIKV